MGPGGEVLATRLLQAGMDIAVVERELIGGECAYWACMPSKTLVRPGEVRTQAQRAPGIATPDLDWADLRDYRDYLVRNLDDVAQVKGYEEQGATVIKGSGTVTGPGRVEVDGRMLETDRIIVATGSDPIVPEVEGLDSVSVWTNRETTNLKEIPGSALVVGGGPVGIELGQFLARFGCEVTLLQRTDRLIPREDPEVSRTIRKFLEEDGIAVRTGAEMRRAVADGSKARVELDEGDPLTVDVIVAATGRRPRAEGLGLDEHLTNKGGVRVDGSCRVADGIWALGDVTGVMPFTHIAKYHGRIAAADIAGKKVTADLRAIPRVVFSDPEIAAVGMTSQQARAAGLDFAQATVELPETIARPWTYERDPRGRMGLLAERDRKELIGAWAVAPLAGEWIHQAALAIKARIGIATLLDTVAQFPTFSESYLYALEKLDLG